MANEDYGYKATIELEAKGTDQMELAANILDILRDSLESVGREFPEVEKVMTRLAVSVGKTSNSLRDASDLADKTGQAVSQMGQAAANETEGFAKLRGEVESLSESLQEAARLAAGFGSETPLADAMANTGFSEADAEKVERYVEAVKTGSESATAEFRKGQQEQEAEALRVSQVKLDNWKAETEAVLSLSRQKDKALADAAAEQAAEQAKQASAGEALNQQRLAAYEAQAKALSLLGDAQKELQKSQESLSRVQSSDTDLEKASQRVVALTQEKIRVEKELADARKNSNGFAEDVNKEVKLTKELASVTQQLSSATKIETTEKEKQQKAVLSLAEARKNLVKAESNARITSSKDTEKEKSEKRLSLLIQERIDLEKELKRVQKGSSGRPEEIAQETKATQELTKAISAEATEQARLNQIISREQGQNPTRKMFGEDSWAVERGLGTTARNAAMASAAIVGIGTASVVASAKFEASFTKVERTSGAIGAEVNKLREELISLTRSIPQSFGDVADIAARGAQLGVATSSLRNFTETLAMFVATSDTVTLDTAVESFGRISNLLGDTQFDRIGAAITKVGVNAAATEAQIISTTQELAPFASAVGMASDEVIGLATAVASLGQPPERARSAFLTLQRVVDNSISSQSDNLYVFADLLGTTADGVEELWKTDPAQFVQSFASALGGVENLTSAFSQLGIHERRAVQVFQALAADARNAEGGLSNLESAMQDSAAGYRDGIELIRQYGLIVDDLSSRWQVFQNAIEEMAASVGDVFAPVVKDMLGAITDFVNLLSDVAKSPIGGFFVKQAGVVALFVAAILSVLGAMSLATLSTIRLAQGLSGLGAAFRRVASSSGAAAIGLNTFRLAMIGTGVGILVLAIGELTRRFVELEGAAKRSFDNIIVSISGVEEALNADTLAWREALLEGNEEVADSYSLIEVSSRAALEETSEQGIALTAAAKALGAYSDEAGEAANATDKFTKAVGANTTEFLKNQMLKSQGFREFFQDEGIRGQMDALLAQGFDWDVYIAAAEKGQAAADAYVDKFLARINEVPSALYRTFAGVYNFIRDFFAGLKPLMPPIEEIFPLMSMFEETSQALVHGFDEMRTSLYMDDAINGHKDALDALLESYKEFLATLNDAMKAALQFENTLYSLGETLGESGGAFSLYSEQGRDGISDVIAVLDVLAAQAEGDLGAAIGDFIAFRDAVVASGLDAAEVINYVSQKIAEMKAMLGSNGVITASTRDFSNLFSGISSGMSKAAKATGGAGGAAKQAAKEVRTLLDYANDLAKVWKRAFEIRFDRQSSIDAITSAFISLKKEAEEAEKRIRDLNNTIRSLSSDIEIQEHYLSIAIEYGDTMRAEAIEAELAKKRAELADKTAELQREQDLNSKSLVGNTEGAIRNRAAITDLLAKYQTHIQTLAAAGANQEQLRAATARLKQEFLSQAQDLGYNSNELGVYAKAFDDVRVAIDNVPRNITVDFNADPALQALNEFFAKLDKDSRSGGSGAGGNIGGGIVDKVSEELTNGAPRMAAKATGASFLIANAMNLEFGRVSDPVQMLYQNLMDNKPLFGKQGDMIADWLSQPANEGFLAQLDPDGSLQKKLRQGTPLTQAESRQLAKGLADSMRSELDYRANNTINPIIQAMYQAQNAAWNIGRGTAINMSAGFNSVGLGSTLLLRGQVGYYSSGGFTGRGGVNEAAGIVHKGEYVVPQKYVDQSTGLPNMNALGMLFPGMSGTAKAPAVSSSGGGGGSVVSLSAATIQAIAQATGKSIYLDGKLLADAASRSYAHDTSSGRF